MFSFSQKSDQLPSPEAALPGRDRPLDVVATHYVNGRSIHPPFPQDTETVYFGMGCFWGAERLFWPLDGVHVTAAGYQGGFTPNPTYEEVCSGRTGHAEMVMVVFQPERIALSRLLQIFFQEHDPTQGMRQGNDRGTQYRSAIFYTKPHQAEAVAAQADQYAQALKASGLGPMTTQIGQAEPFYYAETYHQQYLAKNPNGYCGLKGTGVHCPLPSTL